MRQLSADYSNRNPSRKTPVRLGDLTAYPQVVEFLPEKYEINEIIAEIETESAAVRFA